MTKTIIAAIVIVFVSPLALGEQRVLDEILVTAQKREQSIHDVSISISAFSGDQLKNLGIMDTRDLSRLPGFTYADSGFTIPIFTIRGIGFNSKEATSTTPVGVYIDQANVPFPVMAKGVNLDLERVEILKGPQGTLYGRNTTAGLVNYIAAKPTQEFTYGFEGTYGRFDKRDLEAYASGPLFNDSVLGRVAYRDVRAKEGWQKSLTRPDDRLGKEKRQSGRLITEWTPAERLFINLAGSWWRDNSDTQAPQAFALRSQDRERQQQTGDLTFDERVRNHPLVPKDTSNMRLADWPTDRKWRLDEQFLMGTLGVTWEFSDLMSLEYLGVYQKFESDESQVPFSGLSVENVELQTNMDIKAQAHELRLSGDVFNGSVEWMTGAFASYDKVDVFNLLFTETQSAGFPPPFTEEGNLIAKVGPTGGKQQRDTSGIFGHAEWHAVNALKFTLALRYNREKTRFRGCFRASDDDALIGLANAFNAFSISRGGSGGIEPGDCITLDEDGEPRLVVDDLKEDNVSGRAALDWTPIDDMLFYLSFTRGYKSGGFPILSGGATHEQYEPVTQEKVDAWEVGGKLSLLNRSMQINFAAFLYNYTDKQLLSFINDPVFGTLDQLANIPKSEVKGAELELQTVPLQGLRIALAAAYIETEINRFVGINAEGQEQDFAGNEFNFTPDWSYTAMLNYQRPVFRDWDAFFGVDVSYTGKTKSTLERDPLFFIDDYTLLNYRIGVESPNERWRFTFWGHNVTNAFYVNNVDNSSGDTVARFTGRPQTYGITLSYQSK